jgi:imidazolonepropionase-like amidohydrolase
VPGFVADRIREGADYVKAHLEDGCLLGGALPPLDPSFVAAAAHAAHVQGRMMLVHALTREAAAAAIVAGADGLTHVFLDQPHTPGLVAQLTDRGMHVTATLTVAAALTGNAQGRELADDPRVVARLPAPWRDTLRRPMGAHDPRHLDYASASVAALHRAGVPVLAGSDASVPQAPGLAHGASLHGELRLLVQAGLSPAEALRAATAVPAERFALPDRGRIAPGRRADLLLVDGDPTARIDDSRSIRAVWRGGRPVQAPAA